MSACACTSCGGVHQGLRVGASVSGRCVPAGGVQAAVLCQHFALHKERQLEAGISKGGRRDRGFRVDWHRIASPPRRPPPPMPVATPSTPAACIHAARDTGCSKDMHAPSDVCRCRTGACRAACPDGTPSPRNSLHRPPASARLQQSQETNFHHKPQLLLALLAQLLLLLMRPCLPGAACHASSCLPVGGGELSHTHHPAIDRCLSPLQRIAGPPLLLTRAPR